MIVFDGYITGEAEKRCLEKIRDYEQNSFLIVGALLLPMWLFFAYKTGLWVLLVAHVGGFSAVPLLARIPKTKKEKLNICPKRITIDDTYILIATGKKEYRLKVKDVKEVLDCKTYYEVIFPLKKQCYCCVCQKDLLTKGSLHEFESLFEGKITDLSMDFD